MAEYTGAPTTVVPPWFATTYETQIPDEDDLEKIAHNVAERLNEDLGFPGTTAGNTGAVVMVLPPAGGTLTVLMSASAGIYCPRLLSSTTVSFQTLVDHELAFARRCSPWRLNLDLSCLRSGRYCGCDHCVAVYDK